MAHRFSWGSNKHGRLGFTGVDSVHTPRRLASLKQERVATVAAANKTSAALTASGRLFSWGDNGHGQLGYGTSRGAFNSLPRIVESIKGRRITAVSASKRHTVVLTRDGDVLTWGHKVVPPSKVPLHGVRDTARSTKALRLLSSQQRRAAGGRGSWPAAADAAAPLRPTVHFHHGNADVVSPRIVAIAAGAAHTSMLTSTGVVLTYRSEDPAMEAQEVEGLLGGVCVVKIAAGKTRTAALTDAGEVYAWEASAKERVSRARRPASLPAARVSARETLHRGALTW